MPRTPPVGSRTQTRTHIPSDSVRLAKAVRDQLQRDETLSVELACEAGTRRRYLLRRIYTFLESKEYEFRFAHTLDHRVSERMGIGRRCVHGFVDAEHEVIYIDPRSDILATFVHECLHVLYEDAMEYEVRAMEYIIMYQLSLPQAYRLVRYLEYVLRI